MSFLLTIVGTLLLLLSLAGVALGSFMAANRRTREPGFYFALWWTPALAAAGGVLMGDPVTFTIGAFCFVIAGAAFAFERRNSRRLARSKKKRSRGSKERSLEGEAKLQPSGEAERSI